MLKARYHLSKTLSFFDSETEVADPTLLTATVTDASGTLEATLTFTRTASVPDLLLSSAFVPKKADQYTVVYLYNNTQLNVEYLDVGLHPVPDIGLDAATPLVVDATDAGGVSEVATATLLTSAGAAVNAATFSTFTGSTALTTIAVSNNDALTIKIDSLASKTATFLCTAASCTGTDDATFPGGGAGDTADYATGGGPTRSIDLSSVSAGIDNYIIALNSQVLGANAVKVGADRIQLVADHQGTGSKIVFSNFGATFMASTGFLGGTIDRAAASTVKVTTISVANPSQITTDIAHGLLSGDSVLIYNSGSTPDIDGTHVITKVDATNFTIPVNVAGAGASPLIHSCGPVGVDVAANNVAEADAVTFAEIKTVVEAAVTTGLTVTQNATTTKLVLTATAGTAGTSSSIDLETITATLKTSLGLATLGSQGAGIVALGSNGATTQALYDATVAGYTYTQTITSAGDYFLVWLKEVASVATPFKSVPLFVLKPSDKESVIFTAYSSVTNTNTPHSATTVIVSDSLGAQAAKAVTDNTGYARVELYPGTYTVSLLKTGEVFATNNFTAVVVATDTEVGNNVFTLSSLVMTPTVSDPAAPATLCLLEADIFRMDGKPLTNADVTVALVHRNQLFSGTAVFDTKQTYQTDHHGHVEFSLVQGLQVEITVTPLSIRRIITVPSSAGPVNFLTEMSTADDLFDITTVTLPTAPVRTL